MDDLAPMFASTSAVPVPSMDSDVPFDLSRDVSLDGLEGSPETDEEGPAKKKKKRFRQALSCVPCKKRKIKCDRKMPCEACLKRNAASECHWEEKVAPPPVQVFALASDMDLIKRKIHHIEKVLSRIVSPNIRGSPPPIATPAAVVSAEHAGLPTSTLGVIAALDKSNKAHHANGSSSKVAPSEADSIDVDSDTEDAALVLEDIAMGRRRVYGSLKARPGVESLAPSIPRTTLISGGLTSCRRPPEKARVATPAFFDRQGLLNQIWSALPPRHICTELLELYFDQFDWSWHTHHTPTFRAEVDEFWQLMANGEQNETDPAWLGVFLATLCLALHTRGWEAPLGTLSGKQLRDQLGVFFELAFVALRAAQWSAKPQARVIQTCVLCGAFLTHFSGNFSQESAGHMIVWTSSAIQIARLLGLHSLGSETDRLPPDDAAWPPGDNSMKREMAKRLWHALVNLDWNNGARGGTYNVSPDQFTTPLPANVNDEDIGLHIEIRPRPLSELTDVTFLRLRWQMARHQRRVQDRIRKGIYTYDDTIEIDGNLRLTVKDLCLIELDEGSDWKHGIMSASLHNRFCRIHRPFMARGFKKETKFEPSARLGMLSARAVIKVLPVLVGKPPTRFCSVYRYILVSTLLLTMAALHDIDARSPSRQADVYLDDMIKAREFLKAGEVAPNASVRSVALQGGQMIASLIDAVQQHRAAFDAGIDPHESLVDIFRGLAQRLTSANGPATAPASPALPPTADPTLVEDTLLQSMGLLGHGEEDYLAALVGGSGDSALNHYTYMGDGLFAGDPASIDWSGLLSGSAASGW